MGCEPSTKGPRYGWGGNCLILIKIGIFLIIKVMIQMGNLFVLIRIPIKEQDPCQNHYKLVNKVHLLNSLVIHQTVIYQWRHPICLVVLEESQFVVFVVANLDIMLINVPI